MVIKNITKQGIKQYLGYMKKFHKGIQHKKIGNYICLEDFVLKNGQLFKPSILPKDIERGKMKECYKNASLLALDNPDYYYVEGYAISIIPTLHAWCIDKNKNVIDNTWKDGKEYFGVVIKKSFLRKQLLKQKFYGLLDNWQNRWELLRLDKKVWLENKMYQNLK